MFAHGQFRDQIRIKMLCFLGRYRNVSQTILLQIWISDDTYGAAKLHLNFFLLLLGQSRHSHQLAHSPRLFTHFHSMVHVPALLLADTLGHYLGPFSPAHFFLKLLDFFLDQIHLLAHRIGHKFIPKHSYGSTQHAFLLWILLCSSQRKALMLNKLKWCQMPCISSNLIAQDFVWFTHHSKEKCTTLSNMDPLKTGWDT